MNDNIEKLWREFNHTTPAAFWDASFWHDNSWSPGSLDAADRKRIACGIFEWMTGEPTKARHTPQSAILLYLDLLETFNPSEELQEIIDQLRAENTEDPWQ